MKAIETHGLPLPLSRGHPPLPKKCAAMEAIETSVVFVLVFLLSQEVRRDKGD
jgi:hypothetical protein